MTFQPSSAFLFVGALTAIFFTSCTPDQWVDPAAPSDAIQEANLMNPFGLESVALWDYPANLEGLTWVMTFPSGEQFQGHYVLNPDGQAVVFDDFEPIVLNSPSELYQIQFLHRSEFNHDVSYHVINSFEFTPMEAEAGAIFLGKPEKISARLILSELN